MENVCKTVAPLEPVIISCLHLVDGEIAVVNGVLYFTGWEFVPGVNGEPDECRIAVRLSLPGSAAIILALKAVRALMPVVH
jgi:hypothetical protein